MCKVSLFLADGFEEVEALAVVDLLRRADIDISMISISGELESQGAHKIKVIADKLFERGFSTIGMLYFLEVCQVPSIWQNTRN